MLAYHWYDPSAIEPNEFTSLLLTPSRLFNASRQYLQWRYCSVALNHRSIINVFKNSIWKWHNFPFGGWLGDQKFCLIYWYIELVMKVIWLMPVKWKCVKKEAWIQCYSSSKPKLPIYWHTYATAFKQNELGWKFLFRNNICISFSV